MKPRQELLEMGVAEYWVNQMVAEQEKDENKRKLLKLLEYAIKNKWEYSSECIAHYKWYHYLTFNEYQISYTSEHRMLSAGNTHAIYSTDEVKYIWNIMSEYIGSSRKIKENESNEKYNHLFEAINA